MVVYNITVKVHTSIESEWVKWQKQEHIPEIMASGQFSEHKFYRLLEQDDREGITYVVQYFAPSLKHYETYINKFAPLLREKAISRWGNKFIAFRTIMEVVN
jgi:hypothetical protein